MRKAAAEKKEEKKTGMGGWEKESKRGRLV